MHAAFFSPFVRGALKAKTLFGACPPRPAPMKRVWFQETVLKGTVFGKIASANSLFLRTPKHKTVCLGGALGFFVLMFCALVAAPPSALAREKSTKPRSQVEQVPGRYIQLETMWMPVLNRKGHIAFVGLVVRLWPGKDTRYEACLEAPKVTDMMVVSYNKDPMPLDVYLNDEALNKAITDLIHRHSADGIFAKIETSRDFNIPDKQSAVLTLTCR